MLIPDALTLLDPDDTVDPAHDAAVVGFLDDDAPWDAASDGAAFIPEPTLGWTGFDQAPAGAGRPAGNLPGNLQRFAAALRAAEESGWQLCLAAAASIRVRLAAAVRVAPRRHAVVALLGAVLLSAGVGLVTRSFLPARQAERATVTAPPVALGPPASAVLVARNAIPAGRILRASDLVWRPWPQAQIKPSYIRIGSRATSDFYGYVARAPIAQGAAIGDDKILAPGEHGFLAAVLHPGMRAVSVLIGPETAASGLIMPGDDVDVLFALPVPALNPDGQISDFERAAAQTVLRNIHVLAIDQRVDALPGRAIIGSAATLEVTPKQAEIITLADEVAFRGGMLALSLRSLVPGASGPVTPDDAEGSSHTLDTDVSKLLTDRPVATSQMHALTILRGSAITERPIGSGS